MGKTMKESASAATRSKDTKRSGIRVWLVLLPAVFLLLAACGQKTAAETGAENAGSAEATAAGGALQETAHETREEVDLGEQLKLAWNFLTEGNYKEAILAFTAVLDIDPKNGEAYKGRGDAYLYQASENPEEYAANLALAMQDYALAEQYGYDAGELEASRKAIHSMVRYSGQQAMEAEDMERVQSVRSMLMELALSEDEEVSGDALLALHDMLVGYQGPRFMITSSYVESMDRPIVDFVTAHPELHDKEGAVLVLYCGSVALEDFDTAARYYKEIAAHSYVPFLLLGDYTFREDGFTRIDAMPNGNYLEGEYDIYGRELTNLYRNQSKETRTSYEYAAGSRLPVSSHTDTQFGSEPGSYDRSYEHEDGRLSVTHTFNQTKEPHEYDYIFTYSGKDVTQRFEDLSDPSRSEDRYQIIDFYGRTSEKGNQ